MTKKINYTPLLAVFLILLVGAAYYGYRHSAALPGTSTPTVMVVQPTVLLGIIRSVKGDSLTLSLQQGGIATVIVSSSTAITTDVPKDAKTLAAEFAEFQALKAKAGGKPFVPPVPSVTKTLLLSDLKAGLTVLVTPRVYSTTEATAVSVVVVPAAAPVSAPTPAPGVPASSTPAI